MNEGSRGKIEEAGQLGLTAQNWRRLFSPMFAKTNGRFVLAVTNVQLMLEHTKELLEKNSGKWFLGNMKSDSVLIIEEGNAKGLTLS